MNDCFDQDGDKMGNISNSHHQQCLMQHPSDPTFHFSCHPFSIKELETARHPCDLGYQLNPRLSHDIPMSLEAKKSDQTLGDRVRVYIDFEYVQLCDLFQISNSGIWASEESAVGSAVWPPNI